MNTTEIRALISACDRETDLDFMAEQIDDYMWGTGVDLPVPEVAGVLRLAIERGVLGGILGDLAFAGADDTLVAAYYHLYQ